MDKNKVESDQQFAEIMRGYPILTGPTGKDSGPFSVGEYSDGQNHMASVSTEVMPNHGFDRGWGSRTDYHLRKLKMPLFNGDDVYDWVYQAERFFDIQGLFTTEERLGAAMMCLEGMRRPEIMSRRLRRWQLNCRVRQAMELALLIDESGKGVATNPPNEVGGGVPRTSTGATGAERGKNPFKRMTEAEMADKRAKGLCYRCDGTFGPGHRCPEKALQVLWVGEDEDEEEEESHGIGEYRRCVLEFSLGNTGGVFTGPIRTTVMPNHGFDCGWGSRTDYHLRKLKMPLFNGDDVYDWVYQAERFFDIQGLFTTGERLGAAMMCLEGLHEQFFSISQNGTARDYVTAFEKMAAQLPGLQEEVQEGIFIKGLKPDLQVAVRTQKSVGVRQAMELALLIDEVG
ncbi:ankyrin repeat-containing protein [Tanacetum coccineum]